MILLVVLTAAALLSGCASVTGSTTQSVSVQTREMEIGELRGAVCELANSKGRWFVTTPGSVMIHRSNDDMQVYCSKAGYETGRTSVVSATKAEMFGNILVGGVIGAVIDHNSGSGYEYPGFIQVLMRALSNPDRAGYFEQTKSADSASTPTASAVQPRLSAERDMAQRLDADGDTSRSEGGTRPRVGDRWTYRYSDGFSKSGTYTVRVKAVSADEISDEVQAGWKKEVSTFSPGLALTNRKVGDLLLREVSPYLLSLGPTEPTPEWRNISILPGDESFKARHVGTEIVQVQAGSFEASKIVIEGRDVMKNVYAGLLTRPYTVTIWYAPAVKRFVKLLFSAQGGGVFTAENETIELIETNVEKLKPASSMASSVQRSPRAPDPVVQRDMPPAASARRESGPNPQIGDSWTYRYSDSLGKAGTYTVKVMTASANEVSDELQLGNAREVAVFSSGLSLVSRKAGDVVMREISPYLVSLGPADPTVEWAAVNILAGEDPFRARHAGTEMVQTQAGLFEARKIVIEGREVARKVYGGVISRPYTATIWYAPTAKRFVKLSFTAQGGGPFTPENETIELVETNFTLRTARN